MFGANAFGWAYPADGYAGTVTPPTVPTRGIFVETASPSITTAVPALGVITGWNPNTIETVPVPTLLHAASLGYQPPPAFGVYQALLPGLIETVPLGAFLRSSSTTYQPPATPGVYLALDPSRAETIPVAQIVQAASLPGRPASGFVVLGYTPTAPVLGWLIQGTTPPLPGPATGHHSLGLTPGNPPPSTTTYVAVLVAARPLELRPATGNVQRGIDPTSFQTAPWAAYVRGEPRPSPTGAGQHLRAGDPRQFQTVPWATTVTGTPAQLLVAHHGQLVTGQLVIIVTTAASYPERADIDLSTQAGANFGTRVLVDLSARAGANYTTEEQDG